MKPVIRVFIVWPRGSELNPWQKQMCFVQLISSVVTRTIRLGHQIGKVIVPLKVQSFQGDTVKNRPEGICAPERRV